MRLPPVHPASPTYFRSTLLPHVVAPVFFTWIDTASVPLGLARGSTVMLTTERFVPPRLFDSVSSEDLPAQPARIRMPIAWRSLMVTPSRSERRRYPFQNEGVNRGGATRSGRPARACGQRRGGSAFRPGRRPRRAPAAAGFDGGGGPMASADRRRGPRARRRPASRSAPPARRRRAVGGPRARRA